MTHEYPRRREGVFFPKDPRGDSPAYGPDARKGETQGEYEARKKAERGASRSPEGATERKA